MKTYYYSERGLINNLINYMNENEENLKKFLSILVDNYVYKEAKIFNEFSFGEFGSPDLIIKLDNKLFIIEAKIDTFENSATKKNHFAFKDNASKINIQLLLRKRFIDADVIKEKNNYIIIDKNKSDYKDEGIYKNGRSLKKQSLVKLALEEFKAEGLEHYYVAIVNGESINKDKIFNKFFKGNSYGFDNEHFRIVTWKQIDDAIGKEILSKTWEYTN